MPLILPGNVGSATAATELVTNSCRFNDGSSDHMLKTAAAGSRRIFTFSTWFKRGQLDTNQQLFNCWSANNAGGFAYIQFVATESGVIGNRISLEVYGTQILRTTQVLRDPSAWYHLVVAVDTTSGTANNRCRMYLNGTEITDFASRNNPDQNFDFAFNQNNVDLVLGSNNYGGSKGNYFDGYLAETVWIDGTQYAASDFGEFDSDSGIWKPIDVSGLTFGTNGFYLDYEDSGNLGNDVNGGTDLTEANLTAVDQSLDNCTNNFCTLNPLDLTADITLSEGNLKAVYGTSGTRDVQVSTFGVSSGKWYWEIKIGGAESPNNATLGITQNSDDSAIVLGGNTDNSWEYRGYDGKVYHNAGSLVTYATFTEDNIIGVYLDLDNHKLYFSKDGSLQSATGIDLDTGHDYFPAISDAGSSATPSFEMNFGSPSFAISTSNADDNSYGNFEYSPNITGDGSAKSFYALNTKNLAEFG